MLAAILSRTVSRSVFRESFAACATVRGLAGTRFLAGGFSPAFTARNDDRRSTTALTAVSFFCKTKGGRCLCHGGRLGGTEGVGPPGCLSDGYLAEQRVRRVDGC